MTFKELKKDLDVEFRRYYSKAEFIEFCAEADGRTRVGGPKGKGRLTAKKALMLLGYDGYKGRYDGYKGMYEDQGDIA